MHEISALEIHENFSNVLSRVPYNKSEHGQSSTPWLTLVILGIAHCSQQGALFTVSRLLSIIYKWITLVLWRPLKISG